eukprot:scaffold265327_cov31-Tisochrysis_lutea.AAC.1
MSTAKAWACRLNDARRLTGATARVSSLLPSSSGSVCLLLRCLWSRPLRVVLIALALGCRRDRGVQVVAQR